MHVVLAGGGTAGHTSPLIATAEALLAHPAVTVSAIGTPKGLETKVIPAAGLELELIDPVPLPRGLDPKILGVPFHLAKAVKQAASILKKRQACLVIGFGGYVSTPVYLAAKQLGLPFVIHEQNALPGLANKLGRSIGGKVAISFPDTPLPSARYVGLPLRQQITRLAGLSAQQRAAERQQVREQWGLVADRPTLLISGGSQGARSINQATEIAYPDWLGAGVDVIHVWGPKNFADQPRHTDSVTGATYLPLSYVAQMDQAYLAADIMIGRSGAGTVVETAVAGIPAIFVPLPIGNGEQARNAQALVAAGGALLLNDEELTGAVLRKTALDLIHDRSRLAAMIKAGQNLMPADAADQLAQWALGMVR